MCNAVNASADIASQTISLAGCFTVWTGGLNHVIRPRHGHCAGFGACLNSNADSSLQITFLSFRKFHPLIFLQSCNLQRRYFSVILGCRGLLYGYKFLNSLRNRCAVDFDTWHPCIDNRVASFRTLCPRLLLAYEKTIFATLETTGGRPERSLFPKIHHLNDASEND